MTSTRLPLWVHKLTHLVLFALIGMGVTVAVFAVAPTIQSPAAIDIYYDPIDPSGVQYAYRVVATGEPNSFAATNLPPDAVINASTGWINGNRNTPGVYDVTVKATNGDGATTAVVRFAIHPTVLGVQSTQGVFHAGQSFSFTLHYNTAVTVSGTPRLALMVGPADSAVVKEAVYVSGSGTADLIFSYTVVAGDSDPDGVQVLPSAPQGGSITAAGGVSASPNLPVKYFSSGITISNDGLAAAPSAGANTSGRLANVSSRLRVTEGDGSRSLITGFAISGDKPKRVLLRAVGPTLAGFGVLGALADPQLKLYSSKGVLVADNDNWSGVESSAAATSVGAFNLKDGARDAATVVTLQPGVYTLSVMPNGGDGVALAEVYDLDTAGSAGADTAELVNLSTRGRVEGGEGSLIAGFSIKGTTPRRVLVRGVGPALTAFGVSDALANPTLKIYEGDRLVAESDDWQSAEVSAAATASGAFALTPGSKDAAVAVSLPPGSYTAVVAAASGSAAGTALVEVYQVP